MSTLVESGSVQVRTTPIRLIYLGLLLHFPASVVSQFWETFMPSECGNNRGRFLDAIWSDTQTIDLDSLVRILNCCITFLLARDLDPHDFITKTLEKTNHWMALPSRWVLSRGKHLLPSFYTATDVRPLVLEAVDHYTSLISPSLFHRPVCTEKNGDRYKTTVMLMLATTEQFGFRRRRRFLRPFPKMHFDLWATEVVKVAPRGLGTKEFEELYFLADCRTVGDIDSRAKIVEGTCRIDGETVGHLVRFDDFLKSNNLDLARYHIPDCPVIVCSKEFRSADAPALHRGCAYGAPVYLYGFRYAALHESPKDLLVDLIEDATGGGSAKWKELKEKHKAVLLRESAVLKFAYHHHNESMSVNDRYLAKNVPAKILRRMLSEYTNSGKVDFGYSDFVRDPDIVVDPKRPNLTIRIKRLSECLREHAPGVMLDRQGKGRVRLELDGTILEYKELPNSRISA